MKRIAGQIIFIVVALLLCGCELLLPKPKDLTIADAAGEPDLDIVEEDAAGEPDAAENQYVITLLADSGGGKSENSEYVLYGSISDRSCAESSNADYIVQSCGIEILNP